MKKPTPDPSPKGEPELPESEIRRLALETMVLDDSLTKGDNWMTDYGTSKDEVIAFANAVYAAGLRAGMLRAAGIAEKVIPRAHTYASENADLYRAQDDARDRIANAIRKEAGNAE